VDRDKDDSGSGEITAEAGRGTYGGELAQDRRKTTDALDRPTAGSRTANSVRADAADYNGSSTRKKEYRLKSTAATSFFFLFSFFFPDRTSPRTSDEHEVVITPEGWRKSVVSALPPRALG